MSTAAARCANPAADLGHAGEQAPVFADPRLELARSFMADLPPLAGLEQLDPQPFRARLLERELASAHEQARVLREALRRVLAEVKTGERPHSCDSYLPPHMVTEIERALTIGSLR